jgi:NTE family protein
VDLVAGVSGGSFTALAYALYGERLFGEYQDRFLKRNVQGELIQRILNPANWPRLARDGYGRSELAADYYDEILFGGATFSDLMPLDAPVVVVTGTDLSTGARFEFSQDTFDLLCSDLGSVRLARAAATSSAVPVLLSPVTYRNYGGKCNAMLPIWVQDVANREHAARPAGRALVALS